MSEKQDGGPAFPVPAGVELKNFGRVEHEASRGLSLRDYFAAHALVGIVARMDADNYSELYGEVRAGGHEARVAYALADAMLEQRTK